MWDWLLGDKKDSLQEAECFVVVFFFFKKVKLKVYLRVADLIILKNVEPT